MSSMNSEMSRWELYLLVGASVGLFIWYAIPQLFYALSAVYEIARLFFPDLFAGLPTVL